MHPFLIFQTKFFSFAFLSKKKHFHTHVIWYFCVAYLTVMLHTFFYWFFHVVKCRQLSLFSYVEYINYIY